MVIGFNSSRTGRRNSDSEEPVLVKSVAIVLHHLLALHSLITRVIVL